MIKAETLGMLDVAKINPILTSSKDVANYSFVTDESGDVYLVDNTMTGDDSYKDGAIIPKGQYLNGYLLSAWEGQKLVIDEKHISGGLSSVSVKDALSFEEDGTVKKTNSGKGVHLVVTDKDVTLTEKAIKAKVVIAPASE